ncbi:hypothetical protein EN817_11285 [Mesorhizobium sp. M3A.F.Ca.ET.174.01.1.1]|nr:hypothetical protein EJ074_06135 [Mesorhizobium sp. M3A.F.Ca.ET.080.04.2.1]RWB72139.1 MAG: hypothetical protein EOQ49_12920 [Mesorhizobium sp.]TGS72253.1 hypothetical protein EN844_04750 [Mesorhizobium sp. M3A.F.Ca.ET.201.01.1.1]TGS87925.1 hypothetical protein EN818_11285 [Mesorhizobium sp. M3A.F.Ca.ET.175.01.1.1]TGT28385.1 hypothetical protein EN817_11285 [Mesorhizobium sp. M3A.F.Ca.ET.174.01.1.1]
MAASAHNIPSANQRRDGRSGSRASRSRKCAAVPGDVHHCMSRESVQRFCENDMHKNKDPKRIAWIRVSARRF